MALLGLLACLLNAGSAGAQETQDPAPAATPESPESPQAPPNLVSGSLVPLIVVNTVGVEYERMLHPTLGGIAVRGHLDYVFLGIFDAAGVGVGVHYVFYLPFGVEIDPKISSAAPAGPFVGIGADVTHWRGRFFGVGDYSARLSGTSFEPNVYGGYRVLLDQLFIAPRAGIGWGFYGARYRDSNGDREYWGRGHGFELHFDLVVGVAF